MPWLRESTSQGSPNLYRADQLRTGEWISFTNLCISRCTAGFRVGCWLMEWSPFPTTTRTTDFPSLLALTIVRSMRSNASRGLRPCTSILLDISTVLRASWKRSVSVYQTITKKEKTNQRKTVYQPFYAIFGSQHLSPELWSSTKGLLSASLASRPSFVVPRSVSWSFQPHEPFDVTRHLYHIVCWVFVSRERKYHSSQSD